MCSFSSSRRLLLVLGSSSFQDACCCPLSSAELHSQRSKPLSSSVGRVLYAQLPKPHGPLCRSSSILPVARPSTAMELGPRPAPSALAPSLRTSSSLLQFSIRSSPFRSSPSILLKPWMLSPPVRACCSPLLRVSASCTRSSLARLCARSSHRYSSCLRVQPRPCCLPPRLLLAAPCALFLPSSSPGSAQL
jgi:hypothetical protein